MVSTFFPDPCTGDDLTFRELLIKVWNEVLVRLKDSGNQLSGQDLETIGFALRRVYLVSEAYKAERGSFTLSEWLEQLVGVAKSAGISIAGF